MVGDERAMTALISSLNNEVRYDIASELIESFSSALEVDRELCCLIEDETVENRGGRAGEDWSYPRTLPEHSRAILYCFESIQSSRSG